MKHVDSILIAKNYSEPDLVQSEFEILKINDESNPYIKPKDKIIVALTKCDKADSERQFKELIHMHRDKWEAFDVPPTRIVRVCSLAELKREAEEYCNAKANLDKWQGTTGFVELKSAVKDCVKNSRDKLIKDRCDKLKNNLKMFTDNLLKRLESNFKFNLNSYIVKYLS